MEFYFSPGRRFSICNIFQIGAVFRYNFLRGFDPSRGRFLGEEVFLFFFFERDYRFF